MKVTKLHLKLSDLPCNLTNLWFNQSADINNLLHTPNGCNLWFVCVCVTAEEWECQACECFICGEELCPQSAETTAAGCLSLFSAEPEGQTHQISGGEGWLFTSQLQTVDESQPYKYALVWKCYLNSEVPLEAPNRIAKIMFTESPNSPTSPLPHHLLCLDSQLHAKKFIESHPVKRNTSVYTLSRTYKPIVVSY